MLGSFGNSSQSPKKVSISLHLLLFFFFLSGFNLKKERLNFLAFSLFGFQDNRGKGKDNPEYPPLRCYFFFVFVYNKKQQQQQKQEGQWLALSFNPENFVPGLVIGFILGLLLDLSKPPKNKTNKKNFAPGKPQFAVSNNSDQELKMVCFALFTWPTYESFMLSTLLL